MVASNNPVDTLSYKEQCGHFCGYYTRLQPTTDEA